MIVDIIVKVSFLKHTLTKQDSTIVEGDYNTTRLVFQFEEDVSDKRIVFKMGNPDGELSLLHELKDNSIMLVGYDDDGNACSIFNTYGLYPFELAAYESDGKLTSAPGWLNVGKRQVSVVDNTIKNHLPLFDTMVQYLNEFPLLKQDVEDLKFGSGNTNTPSNSAGGYYLPAARDNGDGTMTISFMASKEGMAEVNPVTIVLPVPKDGEDGQDGQDGADGGYYTPSIQTLTENTFKISFTASKSGMPAVGDVTITLPTAKDGEDGKDGTSVTVSSVTESTESGGENIVTFSDGNTLTVKNGKDGGKGDPYTLTEVDKASIVQAVLEALGGQPVAGYFDENNDIVLTSTLPDGTYTFRIEENGGVYELGTLTKKTTVNKYTVTFVADGVTVAEVEYEESATSLDPNDVPAVPAKDGYTGVWESYDLSEGGNITVNAVYTAVETEPDEPTTPTNFANPSDQYWQRGYRLATGYGYGKPCDGHLLTNFVPAMKGDEVYVTGLNMVGYFNSQFAFVGAFTGNSISEADTTNYTKQYTVVAIAGSSSSEGAKNSVTATTNDDGTTTYSYTILMKDSTTNVPNYENRAPDTTSYVRISAPTIDGVADSDIVINVKRNGVWL